MEKTIQFWFLNHLLYLLFSSRMIPINAGVNQIFDAIYPAAISVVPIVAHNDEKFLPRVCIFCNQSINLWYYEKRITTNPSFTQAFERVTIPSQFQKFSLLDEGWISRCCDSVSVDPPLGPSRHRQGSVSSPSSFLLSALCVVLWWLSFRRRCFFSFLVFVWIRWCRSPAFLRGGLTRGGVWHHGEVSGVLSASTFVCPAAFGGGLRWRCGSE
ncbi:unnamed protein product [Microthlaspi erraticum]|uniref:Uncharacterized protein n=1 Tax=Microthlaspi erraticum TaxID=1685480 RepID=A0A6D2K3F1_9BRAS|nr:unnamed protein product [Microthlaspi erraticum]